MFCPCPSLKHWGLLACLLRLCKQASIGTQFTSGSVFSRECFFPRSHAHPPPSFFLHPRPKAHQKLQTFVAVRRLQGLCFLLLLLSCGLFPLSLLEAFKSRLLLVALLSSSPELNAKSVWWRSNRNKTMDSVGIRMLKVLPLVALGVSAFLLLFGNAVVPFTVWREECSDKVAYDRLGLKELEIFLCTLVLFFKQALASDVGKWVSGYTISLCLSVLVFMAVEGSRFRAGFFLSLTPLYYFLSQAAGVSVVLPAIWLPIYLLYDAGNRHIDLFADKKISVIRVAAIGFFLLFVVLNILGLFFPFQIRELELAILLFQVSPIAVALFWLPFATTEGSSQIHGHKSVLALHLVYVGIGVVWHLVAILFVISDPELPMQALSLLISWKTEEFAVYFLLIDGLILFLAILYLVLLEDGVLASILVTVGSLVFGPASAFSLYFVYREQQISKSFRMAQQENKKRN